MSKLPVLLCLSAALNANAEPLGRVFFTPEQRRQAEQSPAPTTAPAPQRLDGCVASSAGLRLRWVDGQLENGWAPSRNVGDSQQQPLLPPGSLNIDISRNGGGE